MGAELGAVAEVRPEDRHRAGLDYPNPLAEAGAPAIADEVTAADGSTVQVASPKATPWLLRA